MTDPDPTTWERTVRAMTDSAAVAGEDADAAVELSRAFGSRLPLPGSGLTWDRWWALASVARTSLTAARVLEAHSDALAILAEAGRPAADDRTWGVFAAEGPTARLDATVGSDGSAVLEGVKPWCSLGDRLDAALVTAWVGRQRQLFEVDLRTDAVQAAPAGQWHARGLRAVTSTALTFRGAPARAVGEPNWYLQRSGFAWGGLGVAACWYGGALGIADVLLRWASTRDGELDALHVGTVDVALHSAEAVLRGATELIDVGAADGPDGAVLALRVRSVVADVAERVLRQAGHALGPAPLAFDAQYAARSADLGLYVRQHHGERDLAELGAVVLGGRS